MHFRSRYDGTSVWRVIKTCVRCLNRGSLSERLHANSNRHGPRCANLSRPRPILRGTHPTQEQEGVCLTPTRATYYTVGNTDAETACSSTMRSKLVVSKALLRCSESFWQS